MVLATNRNRAIVRRRPDILGPTSANHSGLLCTFETVCDHGLTADGPPRLRWAEVSLHDFHHPIIREYHWLAPYNVYLTMDLKADCSVVYRGLEMELGMKDEQRSWTQPSYPSDMTLPNDLDYAQLEWLIENEWAQQAFLTCLTVSVVDNPTNFRHLGTLNIAKLSSRYIFSFKNTSFWDGLPNLKTLRMFVSPDWRDIQKDSNGVVQATTISPSSAGRMFFDFLEKCIVPRQNISTLDVGWIGGGERATGLFGRNRHVLPAPVLRFNTPTSVHLPCQTLVLPFIKTLKLTNCWFHPGALKVFVRRMQQAQLQTLIFNSISLTAIPGSRAADNILAGGIVNIPQLLPNAPVALHIQAINNALHNHAQALNQHLALPGPPNPATGNPNHRPDQSRPSRSGAATGQNRATRLLSDLCYYEQYLPSDGLRSRRLVNGDPPLGGHLPCPTNSYYPSNPDASCLGEKPRAGSWGEIIDKMTPGATIEHQRESSNANPPAKGTSLKRIEFDSCGYVRLTNHTMNQEPIPDIIRKPPLCLRRRMSLLREVMMKGVSLFHLLSPLSTLNAHFPKKYSTLIS